MIICLITIFESTRSYNKSLAVENQRQKEFEILENRKSELERKVADQKACIEKLRILLRKYAKEVGYSQSEILDLERSKAPLELDEPTT